MRKELPTEFGKGDIDFKKFWMAPDGTFYGVKYEWSHPMWAAEYLKFLKIKYTHAPDELYKRGWVRLLTGFEGQTYTLWYEHRFVPLSSKLKHEIKNLAIELRVMKTKDRNGDTYEFMPENRIVSKSVLKELIKKIIKESEEEEPDSEILRSEARPYKCTVCGHVESITTNHTGPVFHYCSKCSWAPSKGPTYNVPGYHKNCRAFVYDPSVNEITQKDITSRHPHPFMPFKSVGNKHGVPDLQKMTLGNLKALAEKSRRSIDYILKHPEIEDAKNILEFESEHFKIFMDELKRRLQYINKPINENQTPEIKSKHFVVKFGEKELPKYAGKIFFGDVWFANAVKIENDWIPGHNGEWLINRHAGALQMGLPSVVEYFKTVQELLNYLERWLQKSGNLREDLQQRHNQVGYQSQCTGISHGVSSDYNDVQLVRDPLNDPMLNGKLHENDVYKFDDFPETKRGDGFGMAINVYHKTIFLGIIVSQSNGYLVSTVRGPENRDRSYRQDPNKPFKTKDDAAKALHRAWKSLRHGETKSS